MNAIADLNVREILKDRRILFVEDRPQTLEFFLEELEYASDHGVEVVPAETLTAAVEKLSEENTKYDMVVIDLHMPGTLPKELLPFGERIAPELNEGQTLGLWLHQNRKQTPYIYLSSVPDAYRPDDGDQPSIEPLNKVEERPFDFPLHLAEIFRGAEQPAPASN